MSNGKIKASRLWKTHYPIGAVFRPPPFRKHTPDNGIRYRVEEDLSNICRGCRFDRRSKRGVQHCDKPDVGFGACSREERKDHKDVIFVQFVEVPDERKT